jgi:ribosome biogenesis protein BRX1
MLNVVSLLPHCKKDNKVESKASKGTTLNELVELKSGSSCLFFEVISFHLFW